MIVFYRLTQDSFLTMSEEVKHNHSMKPFLITGTTYRLRCECCDKCMGVWSTEKSQSDIHLYLGGEQYYFVTDYWKFAERYN